MKKKILTLIVTFCIILAVIPITVFAEDSVTPVGTATITIINGVDDVTGPNVNTSTDFDKSFNTLYKNLIAQSANDSGWKAMCAIAAGSPAGDIASAILSGLDSYANPNGTNIQKSIIVLTAMGVDVTELSDGQGGTVNLLDKMANTASAIGAWAESPAYALYAYAANPGYGVWGKATNTPENLITTLESYQTDDGGFGWGGMGSPDTTGAVLAALSCYTENAAANVMAAEALEALKAYQNADGGFGYSSGAETNIDSTAMAIVGLCAMGVDPTSAEWTKNGKNPMTALMSFAKEDLTGFTVPAGSDENYATEDAFRAMAAYAGLRNTGKAFNIYTQAASGQAVFEYKEPENNVPKTADSNNQWIWILLAFAGIATIGIIIGGKRHEN